MDKNKIYQSLNELMTTNQKEFINIINQAVSNYKLKYKKELIIKRNELSLIDGTRPQHYYDSLKLIEEWIQKCIDEIKIYLKPICYPLFVYLFLELLEKYPNDAHKFLDLNREKYKAFNDEIDQLSKCQNIDGNIPLISQYMSSKAHIFIPNEIFNFFFHFLNTERLILVLEILNKHFERSNILSKMSQSDEEKNKFLLLNNSSEDIEIINSRTQIYYNKVNKDIIDNLAKGKSRRNQDSLLSKIIIPFPETANDFINVEDNCLKINKISPPTIGCFTLLNTNNKLNCIDMANEGGIIAFGFKNGEIIVCMLDKNINMK
jgi:hypothetical protein